MSMEQSDQATHRRWSVTCWSCRSRSC